MINNMFSIFGRVLSVLGLLIIILLICNLYKNYNKRKETYNDIIEKVEKNSFNNDELFHSMIHNSNPRKDRTFSF